MKISCPSCGGEVDFKSRFSVYHVCPYCTSMLLRTDKDLQDLGKCAELAPDMSVFQLGTTGVYDRRHFQIIGKQRMSYDGGFWNEWFILFDDQAYGWLAEAQGFLMVSTPVSVSIDVSCLSNGSRITINGKVFEVEDIKIVTCAGGSGELPVKGIRGRTSTSIDLVGEGETFASVDHSEDGTQLYLGRYVEPEELTLSNLREIDGW